MAAIRRHWRATLVSTLAMMILGVFLWRGAEARHMFLFMMQAGGGEEHTPVTKVQRDRVLTLLEQIELDRDALVALNLSAAAAEDVLDTVRSFQDTNESTLRTLKQSIDAKVVAVRNIEKAIRMGPFDEGHQASLTTARQELATARSNYDSYLDNLETSVNQLLSQEQQATWTAIKSGWGQAMPIRMLNLTDGQRMAVSDAVHRFRRQRAAAKGKEERDTAVATYNSALDSILTQDQKNARNAYHANFAAASANVTGAFNTVLEVEQEEG